MQTQRSILVALALAISVGRVCANTYVWSGGGANANLNNGTNWVGNVVAFASTNTYEFSDGSARSAVNVNAAQTMGQFVFGGDSFTFTNTFNIDIQNPDTDPRPVIVMNSAGVITFNSITLRRDIVGSGSGVLVFSNLNFVSKSYSWTGAAAVVINDADPGLGAGSTRYLTIGGSQKVIVNASTNGLSRINVNVTNSAVLGGAGFITPGDNATVANVTLQAGGRLSPGDNYYTGAQVGTLTFAFNTGGRLILQTNSVFTFDLSTPTNSDKIAITAGGLTLNKQAFTNFTFNVLPGFGPGAYTLFDSVLTTGSLGSNTTGTVAGHKATLQLAGNNLVLNVTSSGTVVMCR